VTPRRPIPRVRSSFVNLEQENRSDLNAHEPVAFLSAAIPTSMKEALADLADEHDRSLSGEARQAIAAWLERHERERRAA
jgi:hypothetical protein